VTHLLFIPENPEHVMTHTHRALRVLLLPVLLLAGSLELHAQAFQGFTLYSPNNSRKSYLVDMNNTIVHTWTHTKTGGYSCYLLEDGSLLRSALSTNSTLNGGAAAGIVQRVDWNGSLLWEYTYSSNTYRAHHDIEPMPNGNVLLIAWEVKSATECVAAGLNHSSSLWPDHIIEVQPVGSTGGNIVWQWHSWDHLIQDYSASKSNYGVVGSHPELLDINVGSTQGDWMHYNGISYNPELDQIVVSSHNLDEVYVIDHSTTTAQAAGHSGGNSGKGGDYLYRWGRPTNYRASGTQIFDVVHCAYWVPAVLPGAGDIMAFNNREHAGTSMIVELVPPMSNGQYVLQSGSAYGPSSPVWSYTASGFFSIHLGGCQRLPNGNTLVVQSLNGKIFEVNSSGSTVWTYAPGGEIARALRYATTYPGVAALMPVELTSFTGSATEDAVELTWTVASETDNYGFDVQRSSTDGNTWETAGFVAGRGTTTVGATYTFHDDLTAATRATGTVLYRLRQIDLDGTDTYSQEVHLSVSAPGTPLLLMQNYPNPVAAATGTSIRWFTADAQDVALRVYDSYGRLVATLAGGAMPAGFHTSQWDAMGAAPGVYFARLISAGSTRTIKMIVGPAAR
jgi:hypothetical protein